MRLRFEKDAGVCKFTHIMSDGKLLEATFKSIDQLDVISWTRSKDGFKLPDEYWKYEVIDGQPSRTIDFDLMSADDRYKLTMDDFRFAASKLTHIQGVVLEVGGEEKDISECKLDLDETANVLYQLNKNIQEYATWHLTWMAGAKKKSGKMVSY